MRYLKVAWIVTLVMVLLNGCYANVDPILPTEEDSYHLQFTKPEDTVQAQYDTPLYSITVKDGKYILTPKEPLPDVYSCCSAQIYPKFTSIGEMRQGIIEGPISQYELCSLAHRSLNTDGGVEICDPNHLYEFTAPDDFYLDYIMWLGKSYYCHLTGENARGSIYCYNERDYTESFNNEYKDFLTNPLITITEQRTTSDRFATVYYGNTSRAKEKFICYEFHIGNKTIYIQEEYLLEIEDNLLPVSADVPSTIYFWGTENGGYFYGIFSDFTERPSIQWLSQFGIMPYEASASS